MRGGILYARTTEKSHAVRVCRPMCEQAEENHSQIFQLYTVIRQKRTLEDNILQGPGLYVSGSETEVGLVLEIILYL